MSEQSLEAELAELRGESKVNWQQNLVRFEDQDKARGLLQDEIDRRYAASEKVHDHFEDDVTRRFEKVNEFRNALSDLGSQMATRRELELLVDRVVLLERALASGEGSHRAAAELKTSTIALIAVAGTFIFIVVNVALHFI